MSGCGGSDSPAAQPPASSSSASATTAELGALIEAEDAAIYAYGVIGAHLAGAQQARAADALQAHRRLRDDWVDAATVAGEEIPPAAIAYDLPIEVRDSSTALALATEIETRMIAVYESAGKPAAEALARARSRLARLTASS